MFRGFKVCCGPRCGTEPDHRAIFDALGENAVPTMCRGHCGFGVTIVKPGGETVKARDADAARAHLLEDCENDVHRQGADPDPVAQVHG